MCGISLVVQFLPHAAAGDLADLAQMHRSLLHRGPDAQGGVVVDHELRARRIDSVEPGLAGRHPSARLLAAVRRLRVSDLRQEADQPLVSADGQVYAMLNGAIHNHRAIGAELRAAGHALRTQSDTEIVLEAYRRWGTGCFERFDGMWALVIVDLQRGRLVASRDRFGIKPLYLGLEEGRMLLCSEAAPLARALRSGPRLEPARFFEFLSGHPPASTALSFFRGVAPVPPATWFELDLRSAPSAAPAFHRYWDLVDHVRRNESAPIGFAEAAERYRELLKSSVAAASIADARVGSLLSGGLDTTTIVSLWAEAAAGRGGASPETFSITWDDPAMSEEVAQQAVAARVNARSHSLRLAPRDVWDAVDPVVQAQGQPLLGQELIAQNLVYRFAHEHGAVVVLDGSGSDEVQAGLPPYEAEMVYERITRLHLWEAAREVHAIANSYGRSHLTAFRQTVIGPVRRRFAERRGPPRYDWLDPRARDPADPGWALAAARDESPDPSHLNRILYRETKHTNVPTVLAYSDRNSMAHSVEARYPFLDHRLVEFCFSLPASYKVGFGRRKRLLWETAKDYLPPEVLARREKRYFVRLTNWMPLRERADEMRAAARNPAFEGLGWLDAARMRRFADDYLARRHENAYAIWRIYTASRWLDLHGIRGA